MILITIFNVLYDTKGKINVMCPSSEAPKEEKRLIESSKKVTILVSY